MEKYRCFGGFSLHWFVLLLVFVCIIMVPRAQGWSKEGHMMMCRIAQALLEPEAAEAVQNLLPHYVDGDLSALCVWPDQIRHWYRYRWTSPLHFIDTPDNACTFDYSRDCHDQHGVKNMCVAGAPMHVGFTTDEGGNTIALRWYRHKSNLHHVWDREIIQQAMKDYYDKDMELLLQDILVNITDGIWSDDVTSWKHCDDQRSCINKYATESINIACKWAYKGVEAGDTLTEDYFLPRLPVVEKRIAQGGVRLAAILNRVFSSSQDTGVDDDVSHSPT
ncbi:hypothetical protein ACFX2I_036768 [Malus domestica]